MLLQSGNPFKCHEEVLSLQPMVPPKRFDTFPPDWGMLRRSRIQYIYLLEDLCMVPTILQNKDTCYCEFYRAVNFVVRDTATIRNQIGRAIRLGTQEACSRLQLLAPSKKCSLFKAVVNTVGGLLASRRVFSCSRWGFFVPIRQIQTKSPP